MLPIAYFPRVCTSHFGNVIFKSICFMYDMPIVFDEDYDMFLLNGKSTTYAFGIARKDMLLSFYWGPKVSTTDEIPLVNMMGGASFTNQKGVMPLEFNSAWGMSYVENCLKVEFSDGVRSVHFEYNGYEIKDNYIKEEQIVPSTPKNSNQTLIIHLKDDKYAFEIDLYYRLYEELDIIERWMEVKNTGKSQIKVENILSALWNFPVYRSFTRLTHLHGSHSHEFQVARTDLAPGKLVLDSRRGSTGHYRNPIFMLDDGEANEENGHVYFGALAWSGSWKIVAERTSHGYTRILGGLNNYDFTYNLKDSQSLITPSFFGGFTQGGFGGASRLLHDLQTTYILPENKKDKIRKVIYNSWEVTTFSVNETQQMELAEVAAELGVEIFVMDDGWFGERNHDRAGLGDWIPNPEKFPNGLGPLIQKVKDLGMEFGLWFEPEMVNPDSDLYREHPEWVIKFPGREPDQGRNQLNLNLALLEVKEYVYNAVANILEQHPGITYIKWDMNKSICDMPERWMWYEYVKNLYEIFGRLRDAFPYLHIENCSGGGGRADMGLMPYYDTNWTSDNTNPFHRLFIQEGFSMAYTPRIMSAWVTDMGSFDLKYRFYSSMMGIMGIGANILKWTEKEKRKAKQYIQKYKEIREVVQFGDLYRISSPREGALTAVEYVSKDKSRAVLFAFKKVSDLSDDIIYIPVKGLKPDVKYIAPGFMGTVEGKAIMNQGIKTSLSGTHSCHLFEIKKQE